MIGQNVINPLHNRLQKIQTLTIKDYIMKELGVKVLSKIENLISEIEKPHPSAPHKQRIKQNVKDVSFQPQDSHSRKKMSYGYLDRERRTLSKLTTNVYKEQAPFEPFRITNKQTMQILKRKDVRPIHERLDEIVHRKQMHINLLIEQKNKKEKESMMPESSLHDYSADDIVKKYRRMNEEELQEFRNDYDEKNQLRLKKRHLHQLSRIEKETSEAIPNVGRLSRSLSKVRNLKKNYSVDVFKRMNQDYLDRQNRQNQLRSKIVEEEGGFRPVLCEKSVVLAQKAKSNKSFSQNGHINSSHTKCKDRPPHTPPKKKRIRNLGITSSSPDRSSLSVAHKRLTTSQKDKSCETMAVKDENLTKMKGRVPLKPQSESNRLLNALREQEKVTPTRTKAEKKEKNQKNIKAGLTRGHRNERISNQRQEETTPKHRAEVTPKPRKEEATKGRDSMTCHQLTNQKERSSSRVPQTKGIQNRSPGIASKSKNSVEKRVIESKTSKQRCLLSPFKKGHPHRFQKLKS